MRSLAVLTAAHTAQLLNNINHGNKNSNNSNNKNGNSSRDNSDNSNSSNNSTRKEDGMPVSSGGRGGGRYDTDLHGNVNVLLGGAMMGMIIVVIVLLCYCCHRNMRKSRPHEYSPYWRGEPDVHSLEVFTMDSHITQCYDRGALALQEVASTPVRSATPGPPPTYESLIFGPAPAPAPATSPSDKKPEIARGQPVSCILAVPVDLDRGQGAEDSNEGLPSYEAALKLEAHGYV